MVSFKPPVPVEALPSVLGDASVGLVPNRATEATQLMLPVKLLEYMNMGIPVICARLRTIEYYFPDEALQYFEPGNAQQLAEAIELLYRQPLRRNALASRAASAARALSWESERGNFFAAVDSVLPEVARREASQAPMTAIEDGQDNLVGKNENFRI